MTPCNITTSLSSLTHFYVSKSLQRNSIIVIRHKIPKKKKLYWYTFICIYMRSICSVSQKKKQKTWRQWITSIRERKIALNIWHFSHQSMHSIQGKRFYMIVLHVILAYEFHLTHSRCTWSGFNVISLFIGLVVWFFFCTSKILGKNAFDLIDCKEAKTNNLKWISRIAGDQRINILLETT